MESSLRRKCNQNLAEIIGQASLFWMLHSHTNYERTQVPPPMVYRKDSQKRAYYRNLYSFWNSNQLVPKANPFNIAKSRISKILLRCHHVRIIFTSLTIQVVKHRFCLVTAVVWRPSSRPAELGMGEEGGICVFLMFSPQQKKALPMTIYYSLIVIAPRTHNTMKFALSEKLRTDNKFG